MNVGAQDFSNRLGSDLWQLCRQIDSPLVDARPLTRLESTNLARRAFRLQFENGTLLKGRVVMDVAWAELIHRLMDLLRDDHFPRVRGRHGSALLIDWIVGERPRATAWNAPRLRACGRLLAELHAITPSSSIRSRGPVDVAERERRIEENLRLLVERRVLSEDESSRALERARAGRPAEPARVLIHGDFCEENCVQARDGRIWFVDNENVNVDAADFDLARTWYRWPMSQARWETFLSGYAELRDPGSFRSHASFWIVSALSDAAAFRTLGETPGAEIPLAQLRRIARGDSR